MKLLTMVQRYARFTRSDVTSTEAVELGRVDVVAAQLSRHLESRTAAIDLVHIHGAGSSAVQTIVSELLFAELGFREEVVLTPEVGLVTRARPDFVYPLGQGRGIVAEVERGGTTTNNHDLKDFWKVHIAPDAHHLFLIVPMANWNAAGKARERPFARVARRIQAFFGDPRREVDVLSAHVFGYGGIGR
ncbi:hypothetical protein [Cellulomonas fengjieae]|nr:hypothetical protein [Cellulomonas fengjieae]